jgi:hypothetical protein
MAVREYPPPIYHTKSPTHQEAHAGIYTVLALLVVGGLFGWAAHSGVQEMKTPLHPVHKLGEAMNTESATT